MPFARGAGFDEERVVERSLTHVALFAALIAVLGLIPRIDLVAGVPVTAQSLGVMLAGTVLGARRGGYAALLFVALVAMGLPLLAGGRGGLGLFVGPSGGFLVGFPAAAYVAGWIVERWTWAPLGLAALAGSILGGIVVLYAVGIPGMVAFGGLTWSAALAAMSVFLAGDMLKASIAAVVTHSLKRLRPASVMSRG